MKKDELKILLPEERLTLSTGETIGIAKVPFGKLRLFSDAIGKLFRKIQDVGMDAGATIDYQKLFDIAFEEVVGLMALVLDKKRAWFDTISIADGLAILNVIVSQNFDEGAKKNLLMLMSQVHSLLQTQSKS